MCDEERICVSIRLFINSKGELMVVITSFDNGKLVKDKLKGAKENKEFVTLSTPHLMIFKLCQNTATLSLVHKVKLNNINCNSRHAYPEIISQNKHLLYYCTLTHDLETQK